VSVDYQHEQQDVPIDVPAYFAEYVVALENRNAKAQQALQEVEFIKNALPFSQVSLKKELGDALRRAM
jgi:hypothetical protein